MRQRQAQIKRTTRETAIVLKLKLDGAGKSSVRTGIAFLDHMVTLFAKHAVMDLNLRCKGDLEVDAHHTVEDCGIALGQAFAEALGDKRGIRRYGWALVPMDEALAQCRVALDFSNRPFLVFTCKGWKQISNVELRGFRVGLVRRSEERR